MIYLDHAATSCPKPAKPLRRGLERYLELGASPGRGGYDQAVQAGRALEEVRGHLRRFFGAGPDHAVILGHNATDALNTAIQGLVSPGCHVVSTRLEHNSVLRPLEHLRQAGLITYDLAPFDASGVARPEAMAALWRPETRLVVMTHASNVLGTLQPVEEVADLCRRRGVPLLVDASQSAGQTAIHLAAWGVSALAFTGHKSLLGPSGTGGLVLAPGLRVRPSRFGGTGTDSQSLTQPDDPPESLEAGTINLMGALCLGESLTYLEGLIAGGLWAREHALLAELWAGLAEVPGLTLYGPADLSGRLPMVACNLAGWRPGDLAEVLDGDFDIAARAGLHCAPLVHRDLGTFPAGTLRLSLGATSTSQDVATAVAALATVAAG